MNEKFSATVQLGDQMGLHALTVTKNLGVSVVTWTILLSLWLLHDYLKMMKI